MINFSPELLEVLPIYLGCTLKEVATKTDFKYTYMLLYNICKGHAKLSIECNIELNRIYTDVFKLNRTDLQELYKLIEIINKGKKKYGKYKVVKFKATQVKEEKKNG